MMYHAGMQYKLEAYRSLTWTPFDQKKCSLSLPPQTLNYQVSTASTVAASHV